jgi:hypothetical protein
MGGSTGSRTSGASGSSTAQGVTVSGPSTNAAPTQTVGNASASGLSQSNWLGPYYANPLAAGLGTTKSGNNVRGRTSFTSPLYTATTTTTTGITGRGVTAGITTGGGAASQLQTGRRAPTYSAAIGFKYRPVASSRVMDDAAAALARSSSLEASRGIKVAMDGSTLVLRGEAADDHDSRLAEALVRMTPGVHDVRNELRLRETVSQVDAADR